MFLVLCSSPSSSIIKFTCQITTIIVDVLCRPIGKAKSIASINFDTINLRCCMPSANCDRYLLFGYGKNIIFSISIFILGRF